MDVGIWGPPINNLNYLNLRPYSHSRLGSLHANGKIRVETEEGEVRLRSRTIRRYLPRLWRYLADGEVPMSRHHGSRVIDTRQFPFVQTPVVAICIAHLFKHLREMERGEGNATHLLHWLDKTFRSTRPEFDLAMIHDPPLITLYFTNLGLILDPHCLGSHKKLFQPMSAFFVQHCGTLFQNLTFEGFMEYVYALDRMSRDMSEVLAIIWTSIGSEGRHQLLDYIRYPSSDGRRLSHQTRHILRKMAQVKARRRHDYSGNGSLAYNRSDTLGRLHRMRNIGECGIIPRNQRHELRRALGPKVVFQSRLPANYVCYRLRGTHPSSTRHRQLSPIDNHIRRNHRRLSEPATFMTDYSTSDDDMTISTYPMDDTMMGSDYGMGLGWEPDLHGRRLPRRVSYGNGDDVPGYAAFSDLEISDDDYFTYTPEGF